MIDAPDIVRVIDEMRLKSDDYFMSLFEQALEIGVLSAADAERIQLQCLDVLKDKVERYNAGNSTSIRVDTAQRIMDSVTFAIGLQLKTCPNPDMALCSMLHESMSELYEKGRRRTHNMLLAAKAVHARLTTRLIHTQNVFYGSTLVDGIRGFFKLYSPEYFAQEIHITADYPLCNTLPKLCGIEFISAYIHAAYHENALCSFFSADDIHYLLSGYVKSYSEIPMNIYEPVLTAAIGCVVAGASPYRLDVTQWGLDYLADLFGRMTRPEILAAIAQAEEELSRIFNFSAGLRRYVQKSLPIVAGNIDTAMRQNTLHRAFNLPDYSA